MADIMTKVTISANVTGLATAVAGLREEFEGPSAVDVHRNAREMSGDTGGSADASEYPRERLE
jgi:hypothetical protein